MSCMSKELLRIRFDSSSVQTPHYLSWSMTLAPPLVPTHITHLDRGRAQRGENKEKKKKEVDSYFVTTGHYITRRRWKDGKDYPTQKRTFSTPTRNL